MAGKESPRLMGELLDNRDFAALIKFIDCQLKKIDSSNPIASVNLILSRGGCYHQLGIYRKALKDVEDVLADHETMGAALLLQAKIYVALKNSKDAIEILHRLATLADTGGIDLIIALEAHDILTALQNKSLKPGTKIPIFKDLFPTTTTTTTTTTNESAPSLSSSSSCSTKTPSQSLVARPTPSPKPQPSPTNNTTNMTMTTTNTQTAAMNNKNPKTVPPPPPPSALASSSSSNNTTTTTTISSLDRVHRLSALSDPAAAIAISVSLINNGQNREAIEILGELIHRHGSTAAPLAARGTARALEGDLSGAVEDFNGAIEMAPREADFYKRRAQALGALGRISAALDDLCKAKEYSSDPVSAAESLGDAARMRLKQRDYRQAERDVREALKRNPQATALLPLLASCQVSQGDLQDGVATYSALLEAGYKEIDAIINLGMALKELCKEAEAAAMLRKAAEVGRGTIAEVNARRLLAQMMQGLGDHLGAVRELDAGLAVATVEAQRVEIRFLRGACYHAVGLHRHAVEDYQRTLEACPKGLSADAVAFMCIAFYQKEMALWGRAHLDEPVETVCLDADLHPEFKELWCKKTPPGPDFVAMYRTIMQPQRPNWTALRRKPPPAAESVAALTFAADALGAQVQYHHQGFLPNKRQRRMAGFAAIEYAQLLLAAAAARREKRPPLQIPDVGASVCARGRSDVGGGGRGGPGSHPLGWRDAMEVLVKWRQVAEPNDQVLWVDLLTEREFSSGFGSHTPLFTGQTKCVRYYMNFNRALEVAKRVALTQGEMYDAENGAIPIQGNTAAALASARTAEEFWTVIGKDSWVVVPIESTTRPGHRMEGTRLTVVNLAQRLRQQQLKLKLQQQQQQQSSISSNGNGHSISNGTTNAEMPNGNGSNEKEKQRCSDGVVDDEKEEEFMEPPSFEFSIRTPVTPARWLDFDEELAGVFDTLLQALADDDKPAVADSALRFAYYWYTFMPLARGSALCGYVSLLGVFLAAGMPIRSLIPESYQTDWEAILESSPDAFLEAVGGWLLPPEVSGRKEGEEMPAWPCKSAEELPLVKRVLATMRERLEALNGPEGPRI